MNEPCCVTCSRLVSSSVGCSRAAAMRAAEGVLRAGLNRSSSSAAGGQAAQRADEPGSLLGILQEFAARGINLTKLESRPTRRGLGDYCFIIDLEGHIGDELIADALRDLKSKNEDVLFLGSYHAAGDHGPDVRREAEAAWRDAAAMLDGLRGQIGP